jgi:hypothetical protein
VDDFEEEEEEPPAGDDANNLLEDLNENELIGELCNNQQPEGAQLRMEMTLLESYATISSQRELNYATICCIMIFLLA